MKEENNKKKNNLLKGVSGDLFKQISTFLGIIAAFFLILFFLTLPQYRNLTQTFAEKNKLNKDLNSITEQVKQFETLQSKIDSIAEDQEQKLLATIPPQENIDVFLANLHNMARRAGVLITGMDVLPLSDFQQSNVYQTSQLNLTARSSYGEILSFLDYLERHIRLIDVRSITISNAASFSDELASQVEVLSINVNAYVYNLQEVPESPLFPYGTEIDLGILTAPQFNNLEYILTPIPSNVINQPNPFAPR